MAAFWNVAPSSLADYADIGYVHNAARTLGAMWLLSGTKMDSPGINYTVPLHAIFSSLL
jgi:hypothetical protein